MNCNDFDGYYLGTIGVTATGYVPVTRQKGRFCQGGRPNAQAVAILVMLTVVVIMLVVLILPTCLSSSALLLWLFVVA